MKKLPLFDAVLASPFDDAPRLVYADSLIEADDPRGEFIAVQCRLAAGRLSQKDAKAARAREAQLLAAHSDEWFGPVEKWLRERDWYSVGQVKTRRGFLSHFRLVATARGDLETLFSKAPLLESLDLRGVEVTVVPALARLRALEASGDCAESMIEALNAGLLDGLTTFVLEGGEGRTPLPFARLERLTRLTVSAGSPTVTLPGSLSDLTWQGPVKPLIPLLKQSSVCSLALPAIEVGTAEVRALTALAGQLEDLVLHSAKFSPGSLEALVAAKWPALKSLDLSNVNLGPGGAAALAALKAPALKSLDVTYTRIKDEGASSLLRSPLMTNLTTLSLRANRLSEEALAPFLKAGAKSTVTLLNLKKNPLGSVFLKQLHQRFPQVRFSR